MEGGGGPEEELGGGEGGSMERWRDSRDSQRISVLICLIFSLIKCILIHLQPSHPHSVWAGWAWTFAFDLEAMCLCKQFMCKLVNPFCKQHPLSLKSVVGSLHAREGFVVTM